MKTQFREAPMQGLAQMLALQYGTPTKEHLPLAHHAWEKFALAPVKLYGDAAMADSIAIWLGTSANPECRQVAEVLLVRLSEAGFMPARFNLAMRHMMGEHTRVDLPHAFELMVSVSDSADTGGGVANIGGQLPHGLAGMAAAVVGDCWREGRGVAADREKALAFYKLGAERGNPEAAFNAGILYERPDDGRAPDYPAAAHWFDIGMKLGSVPSQTNLGCLHVRRAIPNHDTAYGVALLRRSIQAGDEVAKHSMLLLHRLFNNG